MEEKSKLEISELFGSDFPPFNMEGYIYDPHTPKELAYSKKETCAYRNCQCDAINSHLLQKKNLAKKHRRGWEGATNV